MNGIRARIGLGMMALIALAGPGAWALSGWIEARVAAEARAAVAPFAWLRLDVDGAHLTARGAAPDAAARLAALDALAALGGVTRLTDRLVIALAPPPPQPPDQPPLVVAIRDADGVTLAGRSPGEAGAIEAWRAALPADLALTDATLPAADAADPAAWRLARDYAAALLTRLPQGRVEIAPGRLRLKTRADTPLAKAAMARRIRDEAPDGLALEIEIFAPRPALSPFRFAAARTGNGATLLACHASSEAEAASLLAAFAALPSPDDAAQGQRAALPAPRCEVGLGAPSGAWNEAVLAGLAALAALPAARFELMDSEARLTGLAPTPLERFETAARRLDLALGAAYSMTAIAPPPPPAPPPAPAGADQAPRWFAASRGVRGVSLSGAAPDETTRVAVASYARALFGAASVRDRLTVSPTPPPMGWRRAALAGLEALARLQSGTAAYDGARLELVGVVAAPEDVPAARAALAEAPGGLDATGSRLRVDLPALAARLPVGPRDCIARLGAVESAAPIAFAPSSAEIQRSSALTLNRLAALLRRCRGVTVEIGGHTDSQGRESTNLRLSRARADAVLEALFARGVSLEKMRAAGYGESRPIADNATETGRARNRRIAFTALAPAPAALAAADPAAPTSTDPAQ